jgi:CheY-like chemotaxis protein
MPPPTDDAIILLVEDDAGHRRLVEKNLRRINIKNPIVMLSDGQEALDYLYTDHNINAGTPVLVLLDLNMPVLDGFQVLQRMKSDERTRHIPVIVLTTSDDNKDIARCYKLGCNMFITKPLDYDQFSRVIYKLGSLIPNLGLPNGE